MKLSQLENLCITSGIDISNISKSYELIKALAIHKLERHYGTTLKIPFGVNYRVNMYSPMLCKNLKDITKKETRENILNNKNNEWIAEPSYTGERVIITYSIEEGFRFFSRFISEVNQLPIEFTKKILLISNGKVLKPSSFKNIFPKNFVLDGHICLEKDIENLSAYYETTIESYKQNNVTKFLSIKDPNICYDIQLNDSKLVFKIYDCLYYDKDIKELPLIKRKELLKKLIENLNKYDVPFSESEYVSSDFKKFYENNQKGIILKNLTKPYTDNFSRNKDVQVKYKSELKYTDKDISKDFLVYITKGNLSKYESVDHNDLIDSLECQVLLVKDNSEKFHHIGIINNIPLGIRQEITQDKELKSEYQGKLLRVQGQGLKSTTLSFVNLIPFNWNFLNNTEYESIINEQDLKNLL